MNKKAFNEIGSEFWIEDILTRTTKETPLYLQNKWKNMVFTSAGRGAFSLMLDTIKDQVKYKKALLPSYICKSVIQPFLDKGYECSFYGIDLNLNPIIDTIDDAMVGVFVHMGYFGFATNKNIQRQLEVMKSKGIFIVEDVTHTLFSEYSRYPQNDFYIASIRKWLGIPSGGFLATDKFDIAKPNEQNSKFIELRKESLFLKSVYVKTGNEDLKNIFLAKFREAENLLDNDANAYRIDDLSLQIINKIDKKEIVEKRRRNYLSLLDKIKKLNNIEIIFRELPHEVCPMFFPVLIKEERDVVRKKLVENKIYSPIHWEIPTGLNEEKCPESNKLYKMELSIPCDQRYDICDMQRIAAILKSVL